MWVPLIENNEHLKEGADYFVKEYVDELLAKAPAIDAILLACTHYPLLIPKIKALLPGGFKLIAQGDIVAESLVKYLINHPEIESTLTKEAEKRFFTSGDYRVFDRNASIFFDEPVSSQQINLKK